MPSEPEEKDVTSVDALVIGAGPAGLMAAQEMARAGRRVLVCDAKPTAGRKFLMAGKSGLNLTKDAPFEQFLAAYGDSSGSMRAMLQGFDKNAVQEWATELGQPVFVGSSGRVFPVSMKASPLLRAWLAGLNALGVTFATRWRWRGWKGDLLEFSTPAGELLVWSDTTVLALGGASWPRLGSDGNWASYLSEKHVEMIPFEPANVGLLVNWSDHMAKYFGHPIKGTCLSGGGVVARGEFVISAQGLEGGGIYEMSRAVRQKSSLRIDLLPDWPVEKINHRLAQVSGKNSLTNKLRKALNLDPAKIALLMEFGRPIPSGAAISALLKALPIKHQGLQPIEHAISSAGGVAWRALDDALMLKQIPGVFVAGEMIDWEAPTGGYLLTGCLASGKWAGQHAARWAASSH